jgi:hypothetical protein
MTIGGDATDLELADAQENQISKPGSTTIDRRAWRSFQPGPMRLNVLLAQSRKFVSFALASTETTARIHLFASSCWRRRTYRDRSRLPGRPAGA